MTRYTHMTVLCCFIRITNALNVPIYISKEDWKKYKKANPYSEMPNKLQDKYHANIGCWRLDYAACYGGYIIERMHNEAGGINHPLGGGIFGPARKKARAFVECVQFFEAIENYRKSIV